MFKRFAIACSVAFLFVGSGFWVSPAAADWVVGIGNVSGACVQFDWRGGTATYSGSGAGVFQVDVNNLTDNTIGGGSTADSWSIWVNDQKVVESNVIEQSQVSVSVSGDWVVTVQGIDVGFWAGWYGPQFCNPLFIADVVPVIVPEPVVVPDPPYVPAPQPTGDYRLDEGWGAHIVAPEGQMIDSVTAWYGDPNDGNRGADWSQFYTDQLHGLVEADLNSGNYNGDPLPGVYKVLVASVHFVQNPAFVPIVSEPVPEPIVVSSSEVRPEEPPVVIVPEPVPAPVEPAPQPDPAPIDVRPSEPPVQVVVSVPEPVVTPTPIETPTPEPTIEPTPEPVVEPSSEPTPESTPTPEPTIEPTIEPSVEPTPEPTVEPTIEPTPEPVIIIPIIPEPPLFTPVEKPVEKPIVEPTVESIVSPPTHDQELTALMQEAQKDDVQVPAEIAAIPVLGGAVVAVVDAFNAFGNVGADMTPEVRATAKKEVVAAVIVGQVAQTASMVSAASASSVRRRND